MFKKILIGIILFGVVAVLLLQIDDELNPEVASFLEQAKPAESSDAYLYLLGIIAAEDEDPLVVGQQLLASMQQAEQQYDFSDGTFGFEAYPEDKKLALPDGALFCVNQQESCWQTVFDNKTARDQALKAHAVLLQRYQYFLGLNDYHSLVKPTAVEGFPSYEYLMKANRLVILNEINTIQTVGSSHAIKTMTDHIALLRNHLKNTDQLIGKLIYSAIIAENLDVLSLIIHQGQTASPPQLSLLSVDERDFATVMPREFAMGYDLYTSLDKHPQFFSASTLAGDKSEGKSPAWLVRLVYKPNMTINEHYSVYKAVVLRSQLAQKQFAVTVTTELKNEQKSPYKISIRNYAGRVLNNLARPSFDRVIARVLDLNAKIAIFNKTANKVMLPEDLSYIQNPYYEKGGTAFYSEDGKSICLTGPLDDDKNQRCLRVKL